MSRTDRGVWTANFLILGVAALCAGAWGLSEWQPFEHSDAGGITWPNNVQRMAEFVEDVNGRDFLDAVPVEYVPDREEFERRVVGERSDEERRRAEATSATDEAVGRALGFWDERLQIVEAADELRSTVIGDVAWIPEEGTLLVHAEGATAVIDEAAKADLVMLLTQRLDDQHFHITERLGSAPDSQSYQALVAMSFGDSVWARDQWLAGLDDFHRDQFHETDDEHQSDYLLVAAKYSSVFRALRNSAQTVGVPFMRALHESAERGLVAEAFGPDGPDALDQVSLPSTKYLRRDAKETVEEPPVPKGGELLYQRQLGPFGLFLLMANQLPSAAALAATDGWGNDAWTAYRLDGRVCVDGRIVADSADDADRIEVGLQAFGDAAPERADVLVGRDGDTLLLSACDPGDAAVRGVSDDEVETFGLRAGTLADQIDFTGLPDTSECAVLRWFATHASDEDPSPGFANLDNAETIDDLMVGCSTSR